MGRIENTVSIITLAFVAVEACLFAEALPSNGFCVVAYFAIVA
jgi:hypothetical protein